MKKFKVRGDIVLLLTMTLGLVGCGSSDESDDPDDDSLWTVQSTGVGNISFARIASGDFSASPQERETPICTAFDAEGGSNQTDSQMEIIVFTDTDTAAIQRAIYLDDTICANGILSGYDYADQIIASYTVSSSSFDYNRIDFMVTAIEREVLTTAGAASLNAFNSDAGACSKTDWVESTNVSFADVTCAGSNDTMGGIHNPLADDLPSVGDELEGVYISTGDLFTLALDIAGYRPGESAIATMTATGLSGTANQPMYSRQ